MLGRWSSANNARLFCISCENLSLDIGSSLKRRGWKSLPAAIIKRLLLQKTKKVVNGVFTINQDGKKIFQEEGYRNVQYMPLGFDPRYFFPDSDTGRSIRTELGVLEPVLGWDLLVRRSLRRASKRSPQLRQVRQRVPRGRGLRIRSVQRPIRVIQHHTAQDHQVCATIGHNLFGRVRR